MSAFINGAITCVPLVTAAWLLLRVSRRWLNAATRYSVWWIVMTAVVAAPLLYVPRAMTTVATAGLRTVEAPPEATASLERTPATVPAVAPSASRFQLNLRPDALTNWWIGLSAMMLLRLVLSLAILQRRRSRGDPVSVELSGLVNRCLARCGVTRHVETVVFGKGLSPMVAGPFRPFLLIPAALVTALDTDEMELVCLHEAAHLARYDDIALLLQRVIQAVLVWNPLVHWISRQIDLEREIACDDFVIGLTSEPKLYASCLTRVAEVSGSYRTSPLAAAATDGRSHLATRIELLLDKTRQTGRRLLMSRFAVVVAGLAGIAAMLAQSPQTFAVGKEVYQLPTVQTVQVQTPKLPAPRQVPSPSPPNMRVFLSVTDPRNRFVTGLDQDNFRVLEAGVPQRISKFDAEEKPVSIWIVWDVKQDVDSRVSALRNQLTQMLTIYKAEYPDVRRLQAQIESLERSAASGVSGQDVESALSAKHPGDHFELVPVDAESLRIAAREIVSSPNPRKAVAFVFDQDHQSGLLLPNTSLPGAIADTRAQIYPVTFTDRDAVLAQISRVAVELRNQYVIEYFSKQRSPSLVEVRVNAPRGIPALTPHARAVLISSTR